jgi:hypothetical protein
VYYIYQDYIFTSDFPWLDLSRDHLLRTVRLPLQYRADYGHGGGLEAGLCKLNRQEWWRQLQEQMEMMRNV